MPLGTTALESVIAGRSVAIAGELLPPFGGSCAEASRATPPMSKWKQSNIQTFGQLLNGLPL
jgi:hypothetical protein